MVAAREAAAGILERAVREAAAGGEEVTGPVNGADPTESEWLEGQYVLHKEVYEAIRDRRPLDARDSLWRWSTSFPSFFQPSVGDLDGTPPGSRLSTSPDPVISTAKPPGSGRTAQATRARLRSLPSGLFLPPAAMEHHLRVARRVLGAVQHEIAGCPEGGPVESGSHGAVRGIVRVLPIDHDGHLLHGGHDLIAGDDPVQQPVGDVLGGDPTGRPVLHELHVVDIGHLRTADALVDPADDIAQDPLSIVLQLLPDVVVAPVLRAPGGDREEVL